MRRFILELDNGTVLHIKPPTVRMYYKELMNVKNDPQLFNAVANICNRNDENINVTEEYVIDNFTTDDLNHFMTELPRWIKGERESDPNS